MKSFLFCTSYISNEVDDQFPLRYKKWIDYYSTILQDLGADHIFMIDDASPDLGLINSDLIEVIFVNNGFPEVLSKKINIISFQEHEGRKSDNYFAGWWRSFTYSIKIAEKYGFDKIIHIESDFYIISDRLIRFIKTIDQGWASLYSAYYKFPESAVQVICRECFPLLEDVYNKAVAANYKFDTIAEHMLPFTRVIKEFIGDRLGETNILRQWATGETEFDNLDYYGQLPPHVKAMSFPEFKKLISDFKHEIINKTAETDIERISNVLRANDLLMAE